MIRIHQAHIPCTINSWNENNRRKQEKEIENIIPQKVRKKKEINQEIRARGLFSELMTF